MKIKLITFIIISFFSININSQNMGVGLAYASSNTLSADFLFKFKTFFLKTGFSYQLSEAIGDTVEKQLPNYGKKVIGTGNYFLILDLGAGFIVHEKVLLDFDISIGALNHYTNYSDKRFEEDGYHMIDYSSTAFGIGANIGYFLNNNFELFAGYHTLRKLQLGLRYFI